MSDLRTPEVEDLLRVFAALDDEDTIFTLLEPVHHPRNQRDVASPWRASLNAGKSYAAIEESHRRVGHHHRPRVEVLELRRRRLQRRPQRPRRRREKRR